MKIGLYIVGKKGFDVLRKLGDKKPTFVLSYGDKNTNDNSYVKIKSFCVTNDIDYFDRGEMPQYMINYIDKIFVIGWQFMIKGDLQKYIIIHDSLLPEYKGWAPTVNYLINGSTYLGATAFGPTDKMDTGLIYHQVRRDITYPLKIEKAIEIVSDIYLEVILYIIDNNPKPQSMLGMETFCPWRDKEDYNIDWSLSAKEIERLVDAVGFPYDGAKFSIDDETLTLIDSEACKVDIINQKNHIGKVIKIEDNVPYVICGTGILKLNNIEMYGEKYTIKRLKTRLK